MFKLIVLLAAISVSHSKEASNSEKLAEDCEILLASTRYDRKPTIDEYEHYLAVLEGYIQTLETIRHPEAHELRVELNGLYDEFLSLAQPTAFKSQLRHFVQKLAALLRSSESQSTAFTIVGLLERGQALLPNQKYAYPGQDIDAVVFLDPVVKDLNRYEVHFLERVYRALAKGFVRRENASGIKRLSRTNSRLVELKVHPTSYRLFGCLENGVLTFKGVARKSNSTFNYAAYADFCR